MSIKSKVKKICPPKIYLYAHKIKLWVRKQQDKAMFGELSAALSPNDIMYQGNAAHYVSVSKSAMACIDGALQFAKMIGINSDINKILDLPSGHGRVLRSLKARWPNAEITACDLDKEAVDFCAEAFKVQGTYSNVDIAKIILPTKYDLIWCGSLLTHTDAKSSKQLLDFLLDSLEENGILVITFHGRYSETMQKHTMKYLDDELFEKILASYQASGHGHTPYDGELGVDGYGVSMQKPSWTVSMVEHRDDVSILYFAEKLWDNHQDVLALIKKKIRW